MVVQLMVAHILLGVQTLVQIIWFSNQRQRQYVVPEEGKFLIFPSWLKHSVAPFYGEGERRTLFANS